MTCRCKAQFCYICGRRWLTCDCTEPSELVAIEEVAETGQLEYAINAEAETEADEENLALQMVTDFERQEAEREETDVEGEQRTAEEERRREEERGREEEEQRRQEERITAVSLRFHQLTAELSSSHDAQRAIISERYESETRLLTKDLEGALTSLSMRHLSAIQRLSAESQGRIADAERRFAQEYQSRLAEERRIEEEYVRQLHGYWG